MKQMIAHIFSWASLSCAVSGFRLYVLGSTRFCLQGAEHLKLCHYSLCCAVRLQERMLFVFSNFYYQSNVLAIIYRYLVVLKETLMKHLWLVLVFQSCTHSFHFASLFIPSNLAIILVPTVCERAVCGLSRIQVLLY